jgi:hypothetical protein
MRHGLFCALGALAFTASAQAGVILINDGFEYADQAAFQAAWPAIGTVVGTESGVLTTALASGGIKSINNPANAVSNQYRNRATFAETGTVPIGDQIIWSFDFYDSAPTGAPQRNYSNLQDTTAPGGTNQLIAMGFNNNQTGANSGGQFYMARILGYTVPVTADPDGGPAESVGGAGAFFKLNDFGVGARSLGWHNLKAVISSDDGIATDYEFYVDNVLAERVSNVGAAGTLRSYDNIALGSGLSNGSTSVNFDNMYLEVTPEPTSLSLITLAAAPLLLRRRQS